jgi:predicted small lipoprotein YifL
MSFLRRAVALAAVCALSFSLTACGDKDDTSKPPADTSSQSDAKSGTKATPDKPTESTDDAPTSLTGKPLPDNWPAEVLVPNGELIIVGKFGTGWTLVVEGINEGQVKEMLDTMASNGFTNKEPVEVAGAGWTVDSRDDKNLVTYAYATGGAGEPNVQITWTPAS